MKTDDQWIDVWRSLVAVHDNRNSVIRLVSAVRADALEDAATKADEHNEWLRKQETRTRDGEQASTFAEQASTAEMISEEIRCMKPEEGR